MASAASSAGAGNFFQFTISFIQNWEPHLEMKIAEKVWVDLYYE